MRFFHKNKAQDEPFEFRLDDEAIQRIDNEYPYDDIPWDEIPEEEIPKPKHHRLRKLIIVLVVLCGLVILVNVVMLFFTGKLWFNEPDKNDYPIRGALVNSEMGEIQWDFFSKQNISAAYIRATKGDSFKDECFKKSWNETAECEILTGAYHSFSLNTDGEKQAEYFCNAMGKSISGRLVPAVELDLYGLYTIFPADEERIVRELSSFCSYIEEAYGVKPLIMCSNRCYKKYVKDSFDEYPLWIKDVYSKPDKAIKWDFWCYNNRVRLKGYENSKEYFSMFVYKDIVTVDEFKQMYVA